MSPRCNHSCTFGARVASLSRQQAIAPCLSRAICEAVLAHATKGWPGPFLRGGMVGSPPPVHHLTRYQHAPGIAVAIHCGAGHGRHGMA